MVYFGLELELQGSRPSSRTPGNSQFSRCSVSMGKISPKISLAIFVFLTT